MQEISSGLLVKGHGEDYIEAAEKVHVIEKKLKQLREQVAQDLKSLQERLVSPVVAFPCQDGARRQVVASLWCRRQVVNVVSAPFGPHSFIK